MAIGPAQVDLSSAFIGDDNKLTELAHVLGNSLHDLGIVYLVGHGIDLKLIDRVFDTSKELFDLPAETKKKYSKNNLLNHFSGFAEIGIETLGTDPENTFELKEAFDISIPRPVFPDILPEFQNAVQECTTAIENLKEIIFKLLAKAINIDENIFLNNSGKYSDDAQNYTAFRALRYPQVPEDYTVTNKTRCAEHYDWTIVTFLFQDSVGGLEVKTQDGTWIDANPLPGSIILFAGEILEAWTRGYFPAVYHRILLSEEDERLRRDRYSFGYFIFPDDDFVVNPFDKTKLLQNDSTFTPVTVRSLIQGHVSQAY
ncbi:unnamed protein product [Allacma fusca]|uniref:Fe2OG dioxygenase domain-containing protein n=1 Tax=Allacma fusca TaxID=39272 RepID=A0A8J2LFW9_9HEXA|nr:unnamed protein product [Allacma fusca]